MSTRFFFLAFVSLFWSFLSIAGIKETYLLRVKSNQFLDAKQFDSVSFYLSLAIKDTVLANATDYMNLSFCRLKLKDTVAFKHFLIYSIETGGADSTITRAYFRGLDSNENAYFTNYISVVLPKYRQIFLKKIDPEIEREMEQIAFLDQVCRNTNVIGYPSDTASLNFKCFTVIGHYIDSVNFNRVVSLIKRKKYPDFAISGSPVRIMTRY